MHSLKIQLFSGGLLVLLFAGCVSVPQYAYSQQPDSALLDLSPVGATHDKADLVYVDKIDGAIPPTAYSLLKNKINAVYLSPGKHVLDVFIDHKEYVQNGMALDTKLVTGGGIISVSLAAEHRYLLDANLSSGNKLNLYLIDKTRVLSDRVNDGSWTFSGLMNYVNGGSP
jgi:hypothetical protein